MNETYLEILRYGRSNLDGVMYAKLLKHLNEKGLDFGQGMELTSHNTTLKYIFKSNFLSFNLESIDEINPEGIFYFLKRESLDYLLNYEEIEQARENSSKALKYAKWSLWVSATLAFASIVISLWQVFKYC
jgi:hypothetical protein